MGIENKKPAKAKYIIFLLFIIFEIFRHLIQRE